MPIFTHQSPSTASIAMNLCAHQHQSTSQPLHQLSLASHQFHQCSSHQDSAASNANQPHRGSRERPHTPSAYSQIPCMQNTELENTGHYQQEHMCTIEPANTRRGMTDKTGRECERNSCIGDLCPPKNKHQQFCNFPNSQSSQGNFLPNTCRADCRLVNSKSSENLSHSSLAETDVNFRGPTLPKNRESLTQHPKFSLLRNSSGGKNVSPENYCEGNSSYPRTSSSSNQPIHYATICKSSSIANNAERLSRNSCNYRIQRGLSSHELLAKNSVDEHEICNRENLSSRLGKSPNLVEEEQMQFGSLNRRSHRRSDNSSVKFPRSEDNTFMDSSGLGTTCDDGPKARTSGKCKSSGHTPGSSSRTFKTNCNAAEQIVSPRLSVKPISPLPSVVDLPKVTRDSHKYYTLKVNSARQNSESFV